jgi:hypothetical protein
VGREFGQRKTGNRTHTTSSHFPHSCRRNNLSVFYVAYAAEFRRKTGTIYLNRYPLITAESLLTFEFVSEGPKGSIHKLISFQQTEVTDVFNLAFGDKNHLTGKIDDQSVCHNSDKLQVLATVAHAVIVFTNHFPNA